MIGQERGAVLVGMDGGGGGGGDGVLDARENTDAGAVDVGERFTFTRAGI